MPRSPYQSYTSPWGSLLSKVEEGISPGTAFGNILRYGTMTDPDEDLQRKLMGLQLAQDQEDRDLRMQDRNRVRALEYVQNTPQGILSPEGRRLLSLPGAEDIAASFIDEQGVSPTDVAGFGPVPSEEMLGARLLPDIAEQDRDRQIAREKREDAWNEQIRRRQAGEDLLSGMRPGMVLTPEREALLTEAQRARFGPVKGSFAEILPHVLQRTAEQEAAELERVSLEEHREWQRKDSDRTFNQQRLTASISNTNSDVLSSRGARPSVENDTKNQYSTGTAPVGIPGPITGSLIDQPQFSGRTGSISAGQLIRTQSPAQKALLAKDQAEWDAHWQKTFDFYRSAFGDTYRGTTEQIADITSDERTLVARVKGGANPLERYPSLDEVQKTTPPLTITEQIAAGNRRFNAPGWENYLESAVAEPTPTYYPEGLQPPPPDMFTEARRGVSDPLFGKVPSWIETRTPTGPVTLPDATAAQSAETLDLPPDQRNQLLMENAIRDRQAFLDRGGDPRALGSQNQLPLSGYLPEPTTTTSIGDYTSPDVQPWMRSSGDVPTAIPRNIPLDIDQNQLPPALRNAIASHLAGGPSFVSSPEQGQVEMAELERQQRALGKWAGTGPGRAIEAETELADAFPNNSLQAAIATILGQGEVVSPWVQGTDSQGRAVATSALPSAPLPKSTWDERAEPELNRSMLSPGNLWPRMQPGPAHLKPDLRDVEPARKAWEDLVGELSEVQGWADVPASDLSLVDEAEEQQFQQALQQPMDVATAREFLARYRERPSIKNALNTMSEEDLLQVLTDPNSYGRIVLTGFGG